MKSHAWLLIVLCALLVGCRDGRMRSEYIAGCKRDGGPEKVCACMWDGLKEHYGTDRLAKFKEAGVFPADYPRVTANATGACLLKVSGMSVGDMLGIPEAGKSPASPQASVEPQRGTPAAEAWAAAQALDNAVPATEEHAAPGDPASERSTLALGNHNLTIRLEDDTYVISVDGQQLKRVEAQSVKSKWSSSGGGRTAYALLAINSGGVACPATYFIVEVSPEGAARVSPEFGSCSEQISSTETIPDGVSVSMPDFRGPSETPQEQARAAAVTKTYVWQGGALKNQ